MSTWAADLGMGGGDAQIWSSSLVVTQGQVVQSPADWEFYKRIAATGSGATDPANDLSNYVAASYRRTGSLAVPSGSFPTNTNFVTSGATRVAPTIGAGVRSLLVSATGRGSLTFLGASQPVGSGRPARWEVIIDGRVVLDQTITLPSGQATVIVGRTTMNSAGVEGIYAWEDYSPVEFRRSIEIYITPTLATSGGEYWAYRLRGLA